MKHFKSFLKEASPARQGMQAAKEEDEVIDAMEELARLADQLMTYVAGGEGMGPDRNQIRNASKNKRAIEAIGKDIQKQAKRIK